MSKPSSVVQISPFIRLSLVALIAAAIAGCGGGGGGSDSADATANAGTNTGAGAGTATSGSGITTPPPAPTPDPEEPPTVEPPTEPVEPPATEPTPAPEPEQPEPEPAPPITPEPPEPAEPPSPPPFPPATGEATYQMTFTAQWSSANGFGNVPGPAHFSGIIGAAVNSQSQLWARGQSASQGLENVAEEGTVTAMTATIQNEVAANAARSVVFLSGPGNVGASTREVTFTDAFPAFTFASMVAPSPDWFVGLSQQPMKNASGQWFDTVFVPLRVYDAGTENGDTFNPGGTPTVPQGVVQRLNGLVAGELSFVEGLVNGQAIASVRLDRVR